MNKFVALVDIGEIDLLPLTVRVKKEKDVEPLLKKKRYDYKRLVRIVPIAEFNKFKSKWIVNDRLY